MNKSVALRNMNIKPLVISTDFDFNADPIKLFTPQVNAETMENKMKAKLFSEETI